jgi:peptidoglycan hydrolase-like protein with peptidoglycan-binding domain
LRALGEVGEGVLKTILQSTVRATTSSLKRAETGSEPAAPVKQVAAVQRALTDFGYGQIKPTGVVDSSTRSAIEKFERERKLPVSGQISDRFVRELASITGRTLN